MAIIYTYPTKGAPTSDDLILISDASDNNATKSATLGTALTGAAISQGTPTSAGTAGTAGQLQYDANYIYICTASGTAGNATWERTGTLTPV
tara:strand:- start:405 stop:680 length:276 start_codon:yes stop_codon:yes gene_type:complete